MEGMRMEYYFETDDKLNRRKYAEFLKSMLENCDKYRREDSDGAYVIAIDSPWGTGKTRFAKMLRNYLEDRTKEMGDKCKPGENATFSAIYYNSWETDFSNDALLPLIHSITKSPEFKAERFTQKSKKFLEEFKGAATAVAKVAAYSVLHNLAGETVTEMVKAANDAVTQQTADPLESYQERLNLLDDFRKSLEKVIEHTKQKKLVIIVDELDRCRPTYAIQTLELAKHLFAVKGLVFIFALDIKQLSCSVKTVYGQELDAPGYLCRFFDYISQLPLPDKRTIIEEKIVNLESKGLFSLALPLNNRNKVSFEIIEFIQNIAVIDNLSIRELLTLLNHYEIMIVTFLKGYNSEIPFQLYFFFLFLKLKHLDIYNLILTNNAYIGNWEKYLKDQLGAIIDEHVILQKLVFLNKKNKIKDIEFNITENNVSGYTSKRLGVIIKSVEKLVSQDRDCFKIDCLVRIEGNLRREKYIYDSYYCADQILFYGDMVNWEKIKDLTLPEYYHQRLEMFNFALPADEPTTQS